MEKLALNYPNKFFFKGKLKVIKNPVDFGSLNVSNSIAKPQKTYNILSENKRRSQ